MWRRVRHAAVAAGLLAAGLLTLDRLAPPDLSRYRAVSVEVRDADDRLMRTFTTPDGKWRLATRRQDVDSGYLSLLKAYEDQRFDSHIGVDPLAAMRALEQFATRGRIVSGASTLSMQAARLLEPRPNRSWSGKLKQAARALQLEWRYSKDEILSIYLTLAPFGGNIEGVRAASLLYFGKEPSRLTLAESAFLVGLPQSPERRRPDRFPDRAHVARDMVRMRAHARGAIDAATLAEALKRPAPARRLAMPSAAPHLAQHLATGAAPGAIRTTLRSEIQNAVARLAEDERRRAGDSPDIAIVVVDNRRSAVVAWYGGDPSGRHAQVDLVRARRSPGSALKPFIYGLAFDEGIAHPETLVDDAPTRFGDWMPRNFDRDHQGTLTVRRALQHSLNVPAVAALDRVGSGRFLAALRQAGVAPALPRSEQAGGSLAVALGGVALSPLEMATLYAALANDGVVVKPRLRASDSADAVHRLVTPASAWHLADILAGAPLPEGWANLPRMWDGQVATDRALAFKTGTSYGFRDAWAAGWTAAYTVVVWTGHADGTPRPGHYGRQSALPLLLKAFDRLPAEDSARRPAPADALVVAHNRDLPPLLRTLQTTATRLQAATAPTASREVRPAAPTAATPRQTIRPPRILFPTADATVELGGAATVALRAEGGSGKLRWLVDGKPLDADPFRAHPAWKPDGPGLARLTVIDADGRSASVNVRVKLASR
ncbi:MAG: penicillin-binding protein 1C [Rhodospirillales bacterium]|nr:MAG: penicillin-binding protein 1C [Rhodospirillales bacterium]